MAVESCGEIYVLPEECIANALSLTSPKDAARLSLVASNFRSASQSDTVWARFLPSDYREVLSRAVDGPDSLLAKSKKELYLHLCEHPVLIDAGLKSFSLEKMSGKKCYLISARDLSIVWSDTPEYWQWISVPESRFAEVAELIDVCWFEVKCQISTSMLSPGTMYAAYLVYTIKSRIHGFEHPPAEAFLRFNGYESEKRNIYLDPEGARRQRYQIVPLRVGVLYRRHVERIRRTQGAVASTPADNTPDENTGKSPKKRGDEWMEVELGECFVQDGESGELEVCVMEVHSGNWKSGIIIEGIEIRPKGEGK